MITKSDNILKMSWNLVPLFSVVTYMLDILDIDIRIDICRFSAEILYVNEESFGVNVKKLVSPSTESGELVSSGWLQSPVLFWSVELKQHKGKCDGL